jgi:hypothetical protein
MSHAPIIGYGESHFDSGVLTGTFFSMDRYYPSGRNEERTGELLSHGSNVVLRESVPDP